MTSSPDIHGAARAIVQIADRMKIPYAVGGAVAMGFAGYLRGTRDVDILVLVPAVRSQEFADALNDAGFKMQDENERLIPVDVSRMVASTKDLGQFGVWWKQTRVDIFSPRVPLQDSVLQRRIQVKLDDLAVWITTAEDLVLLKLIFHRPKDLEDARRILAANRDTLDTAYIGEWIPKTLDEKVGDELRDMMRRSGLKA